MANKIIRGTTKDVKLNTPNASFRKATPNTLGARTPDTRGARTPDSQALKIKINKARINKMED